MPVGSNTKSWWSCPGEVLLDSCGPPTLPQAACWKPLFLFLKWPLSAGVNCWLDRHDGLNLAACAGYEWYQQRWSTHLWEREHLQCTCNYTLLKSVHTSVEFIFWHVGHNVLFFNWLLSSAEGVQFLSQEGEHSSLLWCASTCADGQLQPMPCFPLGSRGLGKFSTRYPA